MSLALFTICLISGMYGSEAGGGQCTISERSVPGKALKGHTFKEFAVRAIVECQNTCERDPRCASYNFYIPGKVCELNSQTKEERPEDFVTDELRFYMRREDVDECQMSTHNCSDNATCINTEGSFNCSCKTGYRGNGYNCTDIDECASGTDDCHSSLASCTNNVGSFSCTCNSPYNGDGRTCNLSAECQNYWSLSNADRNIIYGRPNRQCDSDIGPGWFRFEGSAGTRMPTSCPPFHRCNTDSPGWMKGSHPTVADGQVSRRVCFPWSNCCHWPVNITVRNCGSYYVYYLSSAPSCYLRYCGTN